MSHFFIPVWQTVSDYEGTVAIIMALFGIPISFIKIYGALKLKRAQFLKELLDELQKNDEAMYMIDYSDEEISEGREPKWYNSSFHDSEIEKKIDALCYCFNYICYLYLKKHITKSEFKIFDYDVSKAIRSGDFQDYLYNLYHYSKHRKVEFPYVYIYEYGKKKGLLHEEFENPRACIDPPLFRNYIRFNEQYTKNHSKKC